MKLFVLLAFFLAGLVARAQDAPGEKLDAKALAPLTQKTNTAPVLSTPPVATGTILGRRVEYRGLLIDAGYSTNLAKTFSLRKPVRPPEDLENIAFYPGAEHVQGIRLFSIHF